MTLLMSDSFWDPPFCAHVARLSAALLPSCPEWPFTFTHRTSTRLSVTACISRLHTAITVTFFKCRARSEGRGAVHWSLVYCESYTTCDNGHKSSKELRTYARCHTTLSIGCGLACLGTCTCSSSTTPSFVAASMH